MRLSLVIPWDKAVFFITVSATQEHNRYIVSSKASCVSALNPTFGCSPPWMTLYLINHCHMGLEHQNKDVIFITICMGERHCNVDEPINQ